MNDLFPFKFWVGIAEDIHDPLKAGRVRVRIFGYHTADKTILPTKQLPWSMPIMPITSASTSGIGQAPVGMVTGSWVVGFWMDESQQISAIFGTFSSIIPSTNVTTYEDPPQREIVANKDQGVLLDSSGNPVVDSSGNPVAVAKPSTDGWILGQTSEKYETGGKGAGTISSGVGDLGGKSYGSYQFASFLPEKMENGKSRKNANRSPLKIYIASSEYSDKFAGIEVASAEFDSIWKSLASDPNFKVDQHDFIKRNYYDVLLSNLKRNGLDLSNFGIAVQDLIWSSAVQYGANNVSLFLKSLADKAQLTDKDIVELVQTYKYNTVDQYFKSSSQAVRDSIRSRCNAEKSDLLKLIK